MTHKNVTHKIAGVDEAGRGPWAGPVVASAVMMDEQLFPFLQKARLTDSKKCSPAQRDKLFHLITHHPDIEYGIAAASVTLITERNIKQASLLAMRRALMRLPLRPRYILIDGIDKPPLPFDADVQTLIKGDRLNLAIAAASILAKVMRDKIMTILAQRYPYYHWENNKGYGTQAHKDALKHHGAVSHHRRSFKPVAPYFVNAGRRKTTASPPNSLSSSKISPP